MNFNLRKIIIWLVSITLVFVAFWIYITASGTTDIDFGQSDTSNPIVENTFDANSGRLDDSTWLQTLEKAVFPHYDPKGKLDRKFGFEKVLAVVADEWEIEKPYIDIFKTNTECYVTADKGTVRRQAAMTGTPTTKDATFSGNVVIRILSGPPDSAKESFIYLDDITFVSDKNLFFTTGPIKFVSDRALMQGRGLELIYNEDDARLEFLKIVHLEKLTVKKSPAKAEAEQATTAVAYDEKTQTDEQKTVAAAEPQKTVVPETQQPDVTDVVAAPKPVNHYQIILKENVIIDAPQQLIFADELIVHNVADKKSEDKSNTDNSKSPSASQNKTEVNIPEAKPDTIAKNNIPITNVADKNTQQEDIIVTCDNGLIVKPIESPIAYDGTIKVGLQAGKTQRTLTRDSEDPAMRQKLITETIDYFHDTDNVITKGQSKVRFYKNIVPIDVTFSKEASFTPDANQIVLQGNCVCLMSTEEAGIEKQNRLSADRVIIDLEKRQSNSVDSRAMDAKHLTATGGVVRLSTIKKLNGQLIGGMELKSQQIDYDMSQKMFQANGPGLIKIDNTRAKEPVKGSNKFSFKEKCFAVINDFQTLTYLEDANQFIAKAEKDKPLFIQYFPVITEGKYGPTIEIAAKHIVANLTKTIDDRNEISDLTASGGITYSDSDKQFDGSTLLFNAENSILKVRGDEFYPCHLNGAPTGMIDYNLKTGRVKAKILGPATFKK